MFGSLNPENIASIRAPVPYGGISVIVKFPIMDAPRMNHALKETSSDAALAHQKFI
jgi:hypothetical protein